jgi:hypothetical protein
MEYYRVEFNEKQQNFHIDNYAHVSNTYGWITVFEYCTDLEFEIFESFVDRIKDKKLTNEYVLKCASEIRTFIINLLDYGITFESKHHSKNDYLTPFLPIKL